MSIATKTGDTGMTGMLFGSRVSKAHRCIVAVGDIDELNAAIGMIKPFISGTYGTEKELLEKIQHTLTLYMGEIASEDKDKDKYVEVYGSLKDKDLAVIDSEIARLEAMEELKQKGWILYGNSLIGSRCDFASKVCRRAERSVIGLKERSEKTRPLLLKYINRLSDMLHLYGRLFDHLEKQYVNQISK